MEEKMNDRLRMFRKNCGFTQQQIADALNIDRTTYTCYELGKTEPNIETISKITKLLNITYADLLPSSDKTNDKVADGKGRTPRENIYEISAFEQAFLSKIRLMTVGERFELMYEVDQKLKNSTKAKNKMKFTD